MKIAQALEYFATNGVPEYLYVVDGLGGGECWGIAPQEGGWRVYFSERGAERGARRFESEDEAVAYFCEKVRRITREYTGRDIPSQP
jgi:hypothetical protein